MGSNMKIEAWSTDDPEHADLPREIQLCVARTRIIWDRDDAERVWRALGEALGIAIDAPCKHKRHELADPHGSTSHRAARWCPDCGARQPVETGWPWDIPTREQARSRK